jgi:hypothetical protein
MSFSSYKNLGETIKEFQITYAEDYFMAEVAFDISDYFRSDLKLMMEDGIVDNSESAICENLIYPVLKEVWKQYRRDFLLWSQPYFLLVEAKQDNFDAGWGQCLAEMVAAQRLNGSSPIIIFGIVSNGAIWQFGKLETEHFSKHPQPYTIYELDKLFAAVNYVFQQCQLQLNTLIAA